jgi:hypothetical protein
MHSTDNHTLFVSILQTISFAYGYSWICSVSRDVANNGSFCHTINTQLARSLEVASLFGFTPSLHRPVWFAGNNVRTTALAGCVQSRAVHEWPHSTHSVEDIGAALGSGHRLDQGSSAEGRTKATPGEVGFVAKSTFGLFIERCWNDPQEV